MGKNHISHARIPWGFFMVDTGTIRNSKLLESVCLQFCLGSPYIWAILTRLLEVRTWMSNDIIIEEWDVVTHPWHKLGHG